MRSILALIGLAASAAVVAQDNGLLLGVRSSTGASSTVWVGTKGVAAFARSIGQGYYVWSDGGLAHVEQLTTEGGATIVKVTDAKGKVSYIKGEEGRPKTNYYVMYLSGHGVGLLQSMEREKAIVSNVGGGASRPAPAIPMVFKNYAWSELETPAEVGDVFGAAVLDQFNAYATEAWKQGPSDMYDGEASPTNWSLRREPGNWVLVGSLLPRRIDDRTGSKEFRVSALTNPRFSDRGDKGPNWARVKSEYPDAIDFTTSQDGKLTVVVTSEDVFVHRSSGASLGVRLQRVRVESGAVVMTQWLEGDAIAKAAAAVGKL